MYRKALLVITLLILALPGMAEENREAISARLQAQLATTKPAADSIRILYDLFDLAKRTDRDRIAREILAVAQRTANSTIQLDMLRQLTNIHVGEDSVQRTFLNNAMALPPDDDQRETVLFIKAMIANSHASRMGERELGDSLAATFNRYSKIPETDTDGRIGELFRFCTMLGYASRGALLTDSYDDLEKLLLEYPSPSGALRSFFYTSATNAYTAASEHDKAVNAEKELLKIIEQLEKRYRKERRRYRRYNANYYNSYRRILSNYPALSHEEVEDYYHRILNLAAKDPEVDSYLKDDERAIIYYLMANERYAEVLPILKRQIDNPSNRHHVTALLKATMTAAEATGDNEAYMDAAGKYCKRLEDLLEQKSSERYRELQIIYDVTGLRSQNLRLASEKQQTEIAAQRNVIIVGTIATALLVISLLVMTILYVRSRRLTTDLADTNQKLTTERDNLARTQHDLIEARERAKSADMKKTEFINNMSHEVKTPLNAITEYSQFIVDCIEPEKRRYLDRYAKIIALNSELITTLVNDVLDIATIENAGMRIDIEPVSARSICDIAIKSTNSLLQPGVTMTLDPSSSDDVTLNTDASRLGQILFNLLNNAAKFTAAGSITLGYKADRAKSTVTFTVTDTGIGIPAGQEENIFSRFEQLDKSTQGCGLGLYICRLLATLLGGVIQVDTTYHKGARFVLTLPMNAPR
ncbi:MAG: HAMP domain-containing histidine kinase [Pseudoflavonifractor sp.]|nr:HAMP domain-containing histidine kinase [Pseudoflavonifractor sp.]